MIRLLILSLLLSACSKNQRCDCERTERQMRNGVVTFQRVTPLNECAEPRNNIRRWTEPQGAQIVSIDEIKCR